MIRESWIVMLNCPACGGSFSARFFLSTDPGVHTFPNGDPGYPPTQDTEFGDGYPTDDTCVHCGHVFTGEDVDTFEAAAEAQMPDPGPDQEPHFGNDPLPDEDW